MRGPVASQAGHGAIHEVVHLLLRMAGRGQELLRGSVAAETADIRVGLVDLDGKVIGARRVAPHMAEAVELGLDGAEHAVVRMARLALALADIAVLEMLRGQGLALDVLEVLDERRHDMAGAAGRDGGGPLEAVSEG